MDESSMNFDQENVRPFLDHITRFIESGFGSNEVNQVVERVEGMAHDEEIRLEFSIHHNGQPTPFAVQIFMDDIESPDISFYAPAALVEQIDEEMETFCEELGI